MATKKKNQEAQIGCLSSLVGVCEYCKHYIPYYPTMEDPLASPFCSKGHWDGIGPEESTEDPWKDCKDYLLTNTKIAHCEQNGE